MANEKRLIDANALIESVGKRLKNPLIFSWVCSFVRDAPTVDAVEVVHARWVKNKPNPETMRAWHRQGIGKAMSEASIFWTCSCCKEWGTPRYNYCPNCGAKMDGVNEE